MAESSRPVVLVTEPLSDTALAFLDARADLRRATAETAADAVADAEGLVVRTYTQVNRDLLDRAPKLKVVGRAGVALENIDISACRARGVEVVHSPEANTLAVVDFTIAMILQMNRRFWPLTGYVPPEQFHRIRKQAFGRFLSGTTLGIVGCGRIGSRVGRAAAGLGMKVLYNDILDIEVDYPAEAVGKDELYAASDIVTIHVPLTDMTAWMIDAEALAKFKPGAQFINCARGPCVNYADLADALRSGRLSAVAVDCHDPEPPGEDYPLFGLDNAILTPHVAARVPEAMERMCDVVHDVMAVLEGRDPKYPAPRE